jgi:hypothetical protein
VITIRVSLLTLNLLDKLVRLEGRSRNRIINRAVHEHALDYLGVVGHASPNFLRNKLRLIELLQKRIEISLVQKGNQPVTGIDQDRRDMLDEACRYTRYATNHGSLLLLSKISSWIAATIQEPVPADAQTQGRELTHLLETLTKTQTAESEPATI